MVIISDNEYLHGSIESRGTSTTRGIYIYIHIHRSLHEGRLAKAASRISAPSKHSMITIRSRINYAHSFFFACANIDLREFSRSIFLDINICDAIRRNNFSMLGTNSINLLPIFFFFFFQRKVDRRRLISSSSRARRGKIERKNTKR